MATANMGALHTYTQAELETLLKYWQEILRLQDWDIKVRLARHYEMSSTDQGDCSFLESKKTAVIQVLDSADYNPTHAWPQDQEQTLVHELIHLHLCYTATDGRLRIAEEQAVHVLSHALVGLKREGEKERGAVRIVTDKEGTLG